MFKLIPLQISFGTWRRQQWHCKDRQWQWRKKKILSALRASQLFPWFDQPWFTPDFCPHECCLNTWGYENFKGFKLRTSHHERIFFSHIIELCRISLSLYNFSSSILDFFATFKFLHLTTRTSNFSRQTKRWLGNMKVGAENSSLLLQRWTKNSPQWISTPFW